MGTTEHEYIKLTSNRILFYQTLHQAAYFHLSAAPLLTVYV